jgi:Primase C terminal 2 (PriCT-2)
VEANYACYLTRTNGSEAGFAAFDAWSRKSNKHNPAEARRQWDAITNSPPGRIGAGKRQRCPGENGLRAGAKAGANGQKAAKSLITSRGNGGAGGIAKKRLKTCFHPRFARIAPLRLTRKIACRRFCRTRIRPPTWHRKIKRAARALFIWRSRRPPQCAPESAGDARNSPSKLLFLQDFSLFFLPGNADSHRRKPRAKPGVNPGAKTENAGGINCEGNRKAS